MRVCCRRSGHRHCHTTQQRVRECADSFVADAAISGRTEVKESHDQAQLEVKESRAASSAARSNADAMNERAVELQSEAQAQQVGGASAGVLANAEAAAQEGQAVADQANQQALAAQQAYVAAKQTATDAAATWDIAAQGGKCCQWVAVSEQEANPKVSTERCCTANGCTDAGTRLAHKQCSWHGELRDGTCLCVPSYGGLACGVQASKGTNCFNGARQNGVKPGMLRSCNKCYKCAAALAPTKEQGLVVAAGAQYCATEDGPETLCLSCPRGSGLLQLGDSTAAGVGWQEGYRDRGVCVQFPSPSIEEQRQECISNCLPATDSQWASSTAVSCTSVCAQWNQVSLQLPQRTVLVKALCRVGKQVQCHTDGDPIGTALPTNSSEPGARKCGVVKSAQLMAVCHMKEPAAEGFGTQCIDGGQQIAQLAAWDESAHTTIGHDYTSHSGLSMDECRAKCLAQKGCEGGVAHQGDQCRIPNNPRDLQVHLQPADGWSYWRWDGAAHAVEDADKWCCWTWPSDADPQTVLPDWLHNVAAQQYCAGPVLAT